MRRRTAFLAGMVAAATLASIAIPLSRLLVWNVTASVPVGLYSIGGKTGLQRGDRVAIDPAFRLQKYLASRGYLPAGVPLIKEVAALAGIRSAGATCSSRSMGHLRARRVGATALDANCPSGKDAGLSLRMNCS